MADRSNKVSSNVTGRFYVDDTCTDCDLCRGKAPQFFGRDDSIGLSIVYRQPISEEEIALANEAMSECPTESIGNDG